VPTRRNCILLCLISCGETTWDQDRRLHGSTDLPLSESGRTAVAAAAARVTSTNLGAIHHPPDEAATETARILAEAHRVKTKAVSDLADPDLGLLEGLTEQVFADRYPKRYKQWHDEPFSLSPPEGEDVADARARVLGAVAKLLRRSKGEEVAVALHSLGLGFLRCWLADRPSRDLWTFLQDRPRVERYALTGPMVQWMDDEATAAVPSRA